MVEVKSSNKHVNIDRFVWMKSSVQTETRRTERHEAKMLRCKKNNKQSAVAS